jgi:hypothetical protein
MILSKDQAKLLGHHVYAAMDVDSISTSFSLEISFQQLNMVHGQGMLII